MGAQIAPVQKKKGAVVFELDACTGKVCRLQTVLDRYRNACNHGAKRFNDEGIRFEAGRVAVANKVEPEVSHFQLGLIHSMKDCVGQQIARARTSANERSSTIVEILCSVQNELQNILFGHSVLNDGPLDVSRFIPFCAALLLLWIDATTESHSSGVPASDDTQEGSWPDSKIEFINPQKRSTDPHMSSTMLTWSDAEKTYPDDAAAIDLKSDRE